MVFALFVFYFSVSYLSYGESSLCNSQIDLLETTGNVPISHKRFPRQFTNDSAVEKQKKGFSWELVKESTHLPANAVVGGKNNQCENLYIARAWHNGLLMPAVYCGKDGFCHINQEGSEVLIKECEVFCSDEVYWQPTKRNHIPCEAIPVSTTTDGETLYAGKGYVEEYLLPGTVQASRNGIKIAFGGKIHTNENYEILVRSSKAYRWEIVLASSPRVPVDAVLGGYDIKSECAGKVFVARAWYQGKLLPAKLCGKNGHVYVAANGAEVYLRESEVLCSNHVLWVKTKNNEIPSNALEVGITRDGEKLYAGRGVHQMKTMPGMVRSTERLLYITYGFQQITTSDYEILVLAQ